MLIFLAYRLTKRLQKFNQLTNRLETESFQKLRKTRKRKFPVFHDFSLVFHLLLHSLERLFIYVMVFGTKRLLKIDG